MPIHSRYTGGPPSDRPTAAMSALRQPLRPGSAASRAIRFTNFAGGGVNFAAACLTAAHCMLIRVISCSSVSTATSEGTSAAVCVFCGARTLVYKICNAARMLQESILSEARIVSPLQCCAPLQGVRAITARVNFKGQQIAHMHHARALSTRLFLPMLRACLPTRCSTFAAFQASVLRHPHVRCLRRPAQATWDATAHRAAATSPWRDSE